MRSFAVPLALVAILSAQGCAAVAVGGAAKVASLGLQDRPFGQGLDDTSSAATLRAKLLQADANAYLHVGIDVDEGRVLLTGSVPTPEHKARAEQIAWALPAVRTVADEIEIGPGAGLVRSARDELLGAHVRTAFIADPEIKAINYGVMVHKGVVYLTGLARTDAELRRAAQTAARIGGVERVVSYVEIRPDPAARAAAAAQDSQLR